MKKLGVQLWSVHKDFDNNPLETLKKLSGLGYTAIEFAGYAGLSPEQMKDYLAQTGITVMGSHVRVERLKGNLKEEIAMNRALGNKNIIIPGWNMDTIESIKVISGFINGICPVLKEEGFDLLYHNHTVEFAGDKGNRPIDILMELCPDLKLELDTGWANYGGTDPFEFMRQNKDRINLLHLKNYFFVNGERMMYNISKGVIDFAALVREARELGITEHIIEDDTIPPIDKYESLSEGGNFYHTI